MKRRLFLGCVFVVLILSFSFVSAGWFSDTWGKITGNVVAEEFTCYDSDEGLNYYEKGKVEGYAGSTPTLSIYEDCCIVSGGLGRCEEKGDKVVERYCNGYWNVFVNYNCPNGCNDGVCNALESEDCTTTPFQDADRDGCHAGLDSDCGGIENIEEKGCLDDIDNDCDGLIDGADKDCSGSVIINKTVNCSEGETKNCNTQLLGICKDGTQTCKSGEWGDCVQNNQPTKEVCSDNLDNNCDGVVDEGCGPVVNQSDVYQCPGNVVEGLCYTDIAPSPVTRATYEDENIKIWSNDYSLKLEKNQNFDFVLYIQNKKNQEFSLEYTYEIPGVFFQIVNSELFDDYQTKGEILTFQIGETKQFSTTFKALKETLIEKEPFLYFNLADDKTVFRTNVEADSNYVSCGGYKFPESFDGMAEVMVNYDYQIAKCCDDVFYPDFECCSDSDCSEGACIDGICLNKVDALDLARGNKRVLMVLSSNSGQTDSNPCINKESAYSYQINYIENYYDTMARRYLNESSNFINFNWDVIGNFKISDIGLSGDVEAGQILNKVSDYCNLNSGIYDEIIVYNSEQQHWCGGRKGCAGRPIKLGVLNDSDTGFPRTDAITMTHEFAHNFGCRDLYDFAGSNFQWLAELMGQASGEFPINISITGLSNLQVCRGEMGWADLDDNGIAEIYEYTNRPEELKINYSRVFVNSYGLLQFENLAVFGLESGRDKLLSYWKIMAVPRGNPQNFQIFQNDQPDDSYVMEFQDNDILTLSTNHTYFDDNLSRVYLNDSVRIDVNEVIGKEGVKGEVKEEQEGFFAKFLSFFKKLFSKK